ncbi:MAG: hypothetical protein GTO24_11870 [candidate division Zixibacteria bacterium]|nr:hypothetical protein [candidate division Zixibacteria bacterium]
MNHRIDRKPESNPKESSKQPKLLKALIDNAIRKLKGKKTKNNVQRAQYVQQVRPARPDFRRVAYSWAVGSYTSSSQTTSSVMRSATDIEDPSGKCPLPTKEGLPLRHHHKTAQ